MIVLENLTKKYNKTERKKNRKKQEIVAVDQINLDIKKGEIFGLIGPNGAGKTTTLKILSTLVVPDEGRASIDGYDVVKNANIVKNKIGLLSGEFARSFYWRLTGRQNIEFFAKLKNVSNVKQRSDELLELFNLKKWENEPIMKYSTGMKHKIAFIVGLLNDPPVLLLDEPLTGVDPLSVIEIKNIIKNKFKDKTIIWASHNLFEIELMCNKIGLINKGRIVVEGEPEELKKNYWGYDKILIVTNDAQAFQNLENVEIKNNIVEIKTNNVKETYIKIMKIITLKNVDIKEIKTLRPTLEDIFIQGVKNV